MPDVRQRIDRWLWFARIVKTRPLAAALVVEGHVRINRQKIAKPAHPVAAGDIVTVAVAGRVRVLRVSRCAERRRPPAQALGLYEDLTATQPGHAAPQKDTAET